MRITVEFDSSDAPAVCFEREEQDKDLWLRLIDSQGAGFVDSGRLLQLLATAIVRPDQDAAENQELLEADLY
jgi:hypothetical protein